MTNEKKILVPSFETSTEPRTEPPNPGLGEELVQEALHSEFADIANMLDAQRAASLLTPLQVTNLFGIRWESASEEFSCPRCEARLERTRGLMLMSPWAGSVRCTECEYRDSVTGYLGRSLIQVQPMPPGAELIYDGEPEPTE